MASPADYSEMTEATVAFQAALAKLGAASVARTIQLWRKHAARAEDADAAMSAYLTEVIRSAGPHAQLAQDLALAYYRLVRALDTGRTLPPLKDDGSHSTTLHELRNTFAELAETAGTEFKVRPREPGKASTPIIYVKDVSSKDIENLATTQRSKNEAVLRAKSTASGRRKVENDMRKHDPEKVSAKQMSEIRAKSERTAEAVQAATVATYIKDSGRRFVDGLTQADSGCEGWIRIPVGETCAFCLMLCSRGPVYFSKASSSDGGYVGASGDPAYHDNCDCISVPVFTLSDWWTHDLFAENRRLMDLWASKVSGGNYKDSLYQWRRILEGRESGDKIKRTPRKDKPATQRTRRRRSR